MSTSMRPLPGSRKSSSPFQEAAEKVYGLGHHLLIFVYNKTDDPDRRAARLTIEHVIFVSRERTADYQISCGILEILRRGGNKNDIVAFLEILRLEDGTRLADEMSAYLRLLMQTEGLGPLGPLVEARDLRRHLDDLCADAPPGGGASHAVQPALALESVAQAVSGRFAL